MKIDTRYGSIWDELPPSSVKKEHRLPKNQQEALDFYEAAESSIHDSLMKTIDGHNDMVQKSSQLRQVQQRKQALEHIEQQRQEEHTKFLKKS